MEQPIQPIVPEGTPLPTPPVGVPPFPITPFSVWTWSTPVIPDFYWNVFSSEQRIKSICKEIGKIEAYLQYLVTTTNKNIIEIHGLIDQLTERVATLENHVAEEVARLDALIAQLRADLTKEIADREAADDALGERIDQEIIDRTHGDDQLHQEIAQEVRDRTHADNNLHSEISTETQNRIHADDELGSRIDAESQARQAADAGLHSEIAAEATARAHGDEALHTEISTETQARIHADTELEAKIEAELQAEADAREAGDADLRESISTETTERKAADATLGQRITQETSDREAADGVLDTKISTEAHEREAADTTLANDISAETSSREAEDDYLHDLIAREAGIRDTAYTELANKIAKRLLPSEVLAGDEISITKSPDSNEIVISSTVAHSISNLETLITGLQAALTSETEERRADDASLWQAVNERIERGKILAGAGIKVENDPDASTVTISGTTTVNGAAPVEVTGDPESGYTIGVSEATENEAGVITEARVKALAPVVEPGWGLVKEEDETLGIKRGRKVAPVTAGIDPVSTTNEPSLKANNQKTLAILLADGDQISTQINIGPGDARYSTFTFEGLYISDSITPWPGAGSTKPGLGIGVAPGTGLQVNKDSRKLEAMPADGTIAGIISESRVKELAREVTPSLSAKSPLKLEDGELSAVPYPSVEGEGPVKVGARSAQLPGGDQTGMTYSVSVDEATEDTAGIITEARVKELIAEALAAQAQEPNE